MQLLTARVEHMTDWHAYITHPTAGELGYCLGHGTGEPWDPDTATAALAREGWLVVGGWRETTPDAEHQYEADVRQT